MRNIKIPSGYQTVMPYLILKNANGFLQFTKTVFSASEKMKSFRDADLIAHAEIQIGDSIIMFSEASDDFPAQAAGLFIYVEKADETYEKALQNGAASIMPPSDQSYGRSCGIRDPFGVSWWITTPG